jgi:hypothetical protein
VALRTLAIVLLALAVTPRGIRWNEPAFAQASAGQQAAAALDHPMLAAIRNEGLARSQVMDLASWMTDVHGPRLTGTPAISKAADWAAGKLTEWGLANVHRETFPFGKGWSLVRFSAHMTAPQVQPLIGWPKTWTAGTKGTVDADVVRVDIRSDADFERYKGRLSGKIVLTQPARAVRMLDQGTLVGRWTDELLEEAQRTPFSQTDPFLHADQAAPRRAAAPTLQERIDQFFVTEGVVATLDRGSNDDVVRGDNQMSWMTQRTDGGTVFIGHGGPRDTNAGKGVPAITLAVEHYNRMIRILEKNVPVKVELNVQTEFHDETTPNGFNLMAEIPGTDLANEVVLLGAHFDSYPWATGATDNAAGASVMMEALRILKTVGAKPRRTIRIGLWGGEEEGLLGSRAYVAQHLVDPDTGRTKPEYDRLSAYYNLDNGTGRIHGVWLQGNFAVEPIFREWFQPLRDLGVTTIAPRSVRGSDYASFDDVGIPAFQFMQDRLEYNSRTHHSNMDFYDHLQRDDLVQMAVVMASIAYDTAMRPEKLPRKNVPSTVHPLSSSSTAEAKFEPVQPDLFGVAGGQPNLWADIDNDDDLDLFVGFRGRANRLYRNDAGTFKEIAAEAGVADNADTRAAAWGDYDGDGNVDLYVGFSRAAAPQNKLYHNEGGGKFKEVGQAAGVAMKGETRQPSFIDFDNDGDLDLSVAFRDGPNAVFRNEGGRFTNVAETMGIADPRKTVGTVWFDFDRDGDLDQYTANQDGTLNGLFRNDGAKFVDVAAELGVDGAGQGRTGSNGPSVADYDNDGDLDLFVANYGPNLLFRNDGGKFTEVAAAQGVAGGAKATPSTWGDYDNDGRIDLYVSSYVETVLNGRDYLYHNDGARFSEILPPNILRHPASHGIQWVDFDRDGDLDLALADNNAPGTHYLYRNQLPRDRVQRSVQVSVVDAQGRHTRAGSEVRVYASGTRKLLGTRLADTGSGYCAQSVVPAHVGLPADGLVDVEVTSLHRSGRRVTLVRKVNPRTLAGKPLVVKVGADAAMTSTGASPARVARPTARAPR